jgi:small subunit ribosomal protein S20
MANHKSARKRARQAEKRRARNRQVRTRLRSQLKRASAALAGSGSTGDAGSEVRSAESLLRRAASKGVIPRKRASRVASRLAKRVNAAAKR